MPSRWDVVDLGRLSYLPALERQRERNAAVAAGTAGPVLLLVEHDPVVTVSRRPAARDHVKLSEAELAARGIALEPTDRGGDVTYHGPGQLVAYPIVRLRDLRPPLQLTDYLRGLETAVIRTLAAFGVVGTTECGATGVWVGTGPAAAKVCAMGVRLRRGVAMHGLALNVDPDLSHFATIDPCGLGNRPVTSLRRLLGAGCPAMDAVKAELVAALGRTLGLQAQDRGAAAC